MVAENYQPKKPGAAFSMSPEASARQRGEMEQASAEGMDYMHWLTKQRMAARGVAWTRENYLWEVWGKELPAEIDEDEIPEDLRL